MIHWLAIFKRIESTHTSGPLPLVILFSLYLSSAQKNL